MATKIEIGKRIKETRKKAGMTQDELGAKLEIGKSSISEWESGKRSPDFDKLEEMATILDVSFHYLVGWSDDPKYPPMEHTEFLYISRARGNESTDELRKQLHDYIDSLTDEEIRAMCIVLKIQNA